MYHLNSIVGPNHGVARPASGLAPGGQQKPVIMALMLLWNWKTVKPSFSLN